MLAIALGDGSVKHGFVQLRNFMNGRIAGNTPPAPRRSPLPPAAIAFAGLVLAGFLGRRSRLFRNLVVVLALEPPACSSPHAAAQSDTTGILQPAQGHLHGNHHGQRLHRHFHHGNSLTFQFVIN